MGFFIQAGNPYSVDKINKRDTKLSEAMESIFPMNTEHLILFWNHIGIPLSYKYDISYMIDDILMLLQYIQTENEGEVLVCWLPDTFRADWKVKWNEDIISINAVWENLVGDLQNILISSTEMAKKEFVCEWKMPLEIIINALEKSGYNRIIQQENDKLVQVYTNIQSYGKLYQYRRKNE